MYRHYGEIGDVWKHLPLCSFLDIERPTRYIESNAAYPIYELDRTPEREYGVFTLLSKMRAGKLEQLKSYPYFTSCIPSGNLPEAVSEYLGTPGLAMKLLGSKPAYLFCDIEDEPLQVLGRYATRLSISNVETLPGDSVNSLWRVVETLGPETFMHIDPYTIFEKNEHDCTYFDLFMKAVKLGIKTMLWYGYETRQGRQRIHDRMVRELEMNQINARAQRVNGIELEIESIGEDTPTVNPGVPGCGVMIANLSEESVSILQKTSDLLVEAYEDVYQSGTGRLRKRVVFKQES